MPATLPNVSNELNKFCGYANRLRQILSETKKCFEDINNSGRFDGTQIINAELLKEEELEITSIVEHPPTIIVFGQTPYLKSRIVNELFNKTVFPSLEEDSDINLRMVRIFHGDTNTVSLTLPDDFDLVENLESYNGPWNTIPRADLEIPEYNKSDIANGLAVLEVTQNNSLLRYGTQVIVSPSHEENTFEEVVKKCAENATPIIIYGFAYDKLSEIDVLEISQLRELTNNAPIFFVRVPPPGSRTVDTDPPDGAPRDPPILSAQTSQYNNNTNQSFFESSQHSHTSTSLVTSHSATNLSPKSPSVIREHLKRLGYLECSPDVHAYRKPYVDVECVLVENFTDFHPGFTAFTKSMLQCYSVNAASVLNHSHTRCLQMFILSAFDMARDMLITPKKLEFAREKEEELYKSLLKISVSKLDEIKELISTTISFIRSCLIEEAAEFQFIGIELDRNGGVRSARDLQACTEQIREMVLSRLNHAVAGKLVSSVDILRDSYTGTLTRCLESLETMDKENPEGSKTTDALKQILNAAYAVEITVRSSSSFIKNILEKMKQLVQSMPWKSSPVIDSDWKKKVACEMLNNLSESRLAKSISYQIKERLNKSHESFSNALKQLEQRHSGRLDKIEEHRLKLRKVHAPRLAKLALESTSLKDLILHGMPVMGREIGRGQYGVVYSCDNWGKYSPCAIKSVVPPDDKHWNDLALEFFYTKNIAEHDRIVMLRGSVIDYNYGGGTSPAVLLVMERLQRDLYTAIKQGLDWISRLQVSIDVVEGLRYLHSQGLVHRDVKLKNVLLDRENRGKITDLGFCKPEAMMSGSIVGTPIHMAPELFTGHYDNSVDVYAFGILFWYVCAGHVRLPNAFDQCTNKDHLFQAVKKGLRPEMPPNSSQECWELMQGCWEGEPAKRPFFGDVEDSLKRILERYKAKVAASAEKKMGTPEKKNRTPHVSPRHSKQILPNR
ncbi:dual serine/threonine and tyrosine protein kinase [Biomphalaria pfeifferi]|uniref:Dual serine/threonine and tyrosine protein kinase n=1 Tax=Biomphalaria pfeifferi TaxID=112525 RepID=A0AAD8FG77_BIOPF|nr:dual serine/threonine and tyrosine protein kinase [Biomphalaria pfeifferi]